MKPETPDTRPLLRQIIAAIGPGWTAHPNGDPEEPDSEYNKTHMIARNGNMGLYVSAPDTYQNRSKMFEIGCIYPRYSDGTSAVRSSEYFWIKVSRQKPPAQVAKEINRRLMPRYIQVLNRITECVKMEHLRANRKKATEEMIAAALGVNFAPHYNGSKSDREITIVPWSLTAPSGKARVRHDGGVILELDRLDAETAIEIGKILQTAFRCETATHRPG